jgi:hypothetical protein
MALDESDVGIYLVVNVQGKVTTKDFRLTKKHSGWAIEDRRPSGEWVDVTCVGDCVLRQSGTADLQRFFSGDVLLQIVPDCIHNVAFAFCRYSLVKDPAFRGYALVALTQQKPIMLRLAKVVPSK